MGKTNSPDSPCLQKYGVPFYGAAWVPHKQLRSKLKLQQDQDQPQDHPDSKTDVSRDNSSSEPEISAPGNYVVLAGGGGEGRSGIPNAIILSHSDFSSNSLSHQPVVKLGLGSDLPYRMAVHPGGDGLICALPKSCRLFEWDEGTGNEEHKLGVKVSEKEFSQLEDIGLQLAVAFNPEGSVLAVGGEDGYVRAFKWPSMESILNEAKVHVSVKDLGFSLDGKFLVSLGNRGPATVWDVTSATAVATLPQDNDEVFAFCRFSQIIDQNQVLYIVSITGRGGSVVTWNTTSWKRMSSRHIVRDHITSLDVSTDGKLLAVGTDHGGICIINATNMQVHTTIRKAHLGIVTALAFSHDSRALVSASMDSSARVTLIEEKKSGGLSLWIIVFIILLAIAAYYLRKEGIIPKLEIAGFTV